MNGLISAVLLIGAAVVLVFVLKQQEKRRRSEYGPAGCSEFRTDLALDECFDRLAAPQEEEISPTNAPGSGTAASPSI